MPLDRRTLDEICGHPRWDGLRDPALSGGITVQEARAVDRLFALIEGQGVTHVDRITAEHIRLVAGSAKTEDFYARLHKGLQKVLPGAQVVKVAEAVTRTVRAHRMVGLRPRKGRQPVCRYSVPEADLPVFWQSALQDMRDRIPSDSGILPAAKMVPTISNALRQLAHASKARGLVIGLSRETFDALRADQRAREVAEATLASTFAAIHSFARYIGAHPDALAVSEALVVRYRKAAALSPKRKQAHLHRLGSDPGVALRTARDLLSRAERLRDPRRAQSHRNRALALALFSVIPLRLSDTRLVFGESLLWSGSAYEISIRTSKNEVVFEARIDDALAPYIDAVLLQGLDRAYLDRTRQAALASNRPLFVSVTGKGVAPGYVSHCWREHMGTGVHIARSIVHEALDAADGALGTMNALLLCAQNDPLTAAAYQGEATKRARVRRSQIGLAEIAGELPEEIWKL